MREQGSGEGLAACVVLTEWGNENLEDPGGKIMKSLLTVLTGGRVLKSREDSGGRTKEFVRFSQEREEHITFWWDEGGSCSES